VTGSFRSEGVGSLLRPPTLLEARVQHEHGDLDDESFKLIEDLAIQEAIALQEHCGLDVITDGELRRRSWVSHFVDSFEGFDAVQGGVRMPWRGNGPEPSGIGARPVVVERLRWRRSMCAEEWTFLRAATRSTGKATLVSAQSAAAFYDREQSAGAYPTHDAYCADLVDLLRQEVSELACLGCRYIQLDAPQYGVLVDEELRETLRRDGRDPDRMIDAGIEMDNAIIDGFPGVTFGLHICRGNARGMYFGSGDYAPIARVFQRSHFQRFLLEYDDERSGDFAPLASLPDDRTAVLGLVTTKSGRLEDPSEVLGRIREATAVVPAERLALSPQCGFASMMEGNPLTAQEQQRKLELVVRVANEVWG
jgi:5-methyltetrahydropteroyltriglutamate--homocysteine methyltransferase